MQCRSRPRSPTPRIEEVATRRLVEKFSRERNADAAPRDEAPDQRRPSVPDRREFVRTAGTHRPDGAYVVERRCAESSGHRKVFDGFDECRRLYERLPDEFTAEDVRQPAVTGARRHMLVWHFAEHDGFDCELAARQPLTVRKRDRPEVPPE